MNEGLAGVDIVMMLRLQLERMAGAFVPSTREYFRFYGLDREKLAYAKPGALVMHPGPMNRGVEIDSDIADDIEVERHPGTGGDGRRHPHGGARCAVARSAARRTQRAMTRTAFINARLLDPATGLDAPGAMLVDGETIADFGPRLFHDAKPVRCARSSIAEAWRFRRA